LCLVVLGYGVKIEDANIAAHVREIATSHPSATLILGLKSSTKLLVSVIARKKLKNRRFEVLFKGIS
jgi:hypothetical protein